MEQGNRYRNCKKCNRIIPLCQLLCRECDDKEKEYFKNVNRN